MVCARPDDRETWPYHFSLRFVTVARRSSCDPIALIIMTFEADWALNNNYLFIYVSIVWSDRPDMTFEVDLALKNNYVSINVSVIRSDGLFDLVADSFVGNMVFV